MRRMVDKVLAKAIAAPHPIDRLTDRELEVFELIGQGRTTREIGISPSRWLHNGRYLSGADQREAASSKTPRSFTPKRADGCGERGAACN